MKFFTDGWARICFVVSIAITVALLFYGLNNFEQPSKNALNIKYSEAVALQMNDPNCSSARNITEDTYGSMISPHLFEECAAFVFYRMHFTQMLSGTFAEINSYQLPNDAEWYRRHVDIIKNHAESDLKNFQIHVYFYPILGFFTVWLAYISSRIIFIWIFAGFRK